MSDVAGPSDVAARERLIFALDVPRAEDAGALVDTLGDAVSFYKVGLELWVSGAPDHPNMCAALVERGKKVMVDLKLFDVPETVGRAVKRLTDFGPEFITVHGNDRMLEAAVANKGDAKILAVTALTSLDDGDLQALGFQTDVAKLVLSRAERALEIGCDGVVSSGLEAAPLREHHGDSFLIVTPGIRPVANVDDQKRTVDVAQAFRNGASHIVVGRPIRDAPDPRRAAQDIQATIAALFSNGA